MAFEQTINKSHKSCNSRQKLYVAKWEIIYCENEVLVISNLLNDLFSNSSNYDLEVNRKFSAAATASGERDMSIIYVIERNDDPFSTTDQPVAFRA